MSLSVLQSKLCNMCMHKMCNRIDTTEYTKLFQIMIFKVSVPGRNKRQEPWCASPLVTPHWLLCVCNHGDPVKNKKGKEPNTSYVFIFSQKVWDFLAWGLMTGPKRTFAGVRNKTVIRVLE